MRFIFLFLSAVLLFSISGCATIFSTPNDTVWIKVNPPSATVIANGIRIPGSGMITLYRGDNIVVTTENGQPIKTIYHTFNPISILNVFFWPGFIVDLLTGAIFDFPASVIIMHPQAGGPTTPVRPEGPLP